MTKVRTSQLSRADSSAKPEQGGASSHLDGASDVDGLLETLGKSAPSKASAAAKKSQVGAGDDGFEAGRVRAAGLAKLAQTPAKQPALKPRAAPGTALAALNEAKPPGVYFREEENDSGREESGDPELDAAVEEAIQLLFGVAGIHHIGPGQNEQGERVVVVAAARGFNESSLARVPAKVRGFATLLALPFELLPLRRT